jgi:hypothetical protein
MFFIISGKDLTQSFGDLLFIYYINESSELVDL